MSLHRRSPCTHHTNIAFVGNLAQSIHLLACCGRCTRSEELERHRKGQTACKTHSELGSQQLERSNSTWGEKANILWKKKKNKCVQQRKQLQQLQPQLLPLLICCAAVTSVRQDNISDKNGLWKLFINSSLLYFFFIFLSIFIALFGP